MSILSQIPGAAVGFVVGAFTPAIGRKIKSWFVKETTVLKNDVKTEATNIQKKL